MHLGLHGSILERAFHASPMPLVTVGVVVFGSVTVSRCEDPHHPTGLCQQNPDLK
jgi:hypothetical protein